MPGQVNIKVPPTGQGFEDRFKTIHHVAMIKLAAIENHKRNAATVPFGMNLSIVDLRRMAV